MRARKIALLILVFALMAPTISARFEGVSSPGMSYGGAVGGERFHSVHGPTMRYDGYFGGHAYSSSLDRWVFIGGWGIGPDPDFSEMVKAHQERFDLAKSVFGFRP